MSGAGFKVWVLPRPLPTPVLAFAIRELGCAAGVMVTASHNPPQDNGYKVYLGDGSQIVPPADAGIAAQIAAVGPLADVPRGDGGDRARRATSSTATSTRSPSSAEDGPRDLDIVYTPLHGVGGTSVLAGARDGRLRRTARGRAAGASRTRTSRPSRSPTRRSRARWTSRWRWPREHDADLVVANDPDADRCAAAVPDRPTTAGWRMLRGDEVGALLASHLMPRGRTGTCAASIVSSSPARADGRRRRPAATSRR